MREKIIIIITLVILLVDIKNIIRIKRVPKKRLL